MGKSDVHLMFSIVVKLSNRINICLGVLNVEKLGSIKLKKS